MTTVRNYMEELRSGGINFIDIGSSGSLDEKWNPIKPLINLVGFDPNKEECDRQNRLPSRYRTSIFLPYAVHGKEGIETLYKTRSIYCYSLLKPNKEWLDRFSFHELFDITGEEPIEVKSIDKIKELDGFSPDVIKMDVQGLELPILKKAGRLLEHAFYVETESGFTENYIGETTYSQIDEFMRANGFLMFDINVSHRISRNNKFKDFPTGGEQILWCETVWLKDYIAMDKQNKFIPGLFSDKKIKKILILCALQKCFDFGFELAVFFYRKNLLSKRDLDSLNNLEAWSMPELDMSHNEYTKNAFVANKQVTSPYISRKLLLLSKLLNLFPYKFIKAIHNASGLTLKG